MKSCRLTVSDEVEIQQSSAVFYFTSSEGW